MTRFLLLSATFLLFTLCGHMGGPESLSARFGHCSGQNTAGCDCTKRYFDGEGIGFEEAFCGGVLGPLQPYEVLAQPAREGALVLWINSGNHKFQFRIHRKLASGSEWQQIAHQDVEGRVDAGKFIFLDRSVVAGESYYYGVSATSLLGSESDIVSMASPLTMP